MPSAVLTRLPAQSWKAVWASPSQSIFPRLRLSSPAASLMASRAATRASPAESSSVGSADSTMSIMSLSS
ncbi:hypothetical protein DMA10_27930 [Streptomyces sp. WAC 01420]|nr:hypothetical protein DLM49_09320 [Streptomyces sp. WAC 01438]RSM91037.1 hypothetical protein DMA10_27930 [Streptomyces sp. WAC 01420]